jgi:hypothetical protein
VNGGYFNGDRVRFLGFGEPDPHSRLTVGTEGTVAHIDDLGTVHVRWDDGGQLGLIVDPPPGHPADRIEHVASPSEIARGDLLRVRDAMRSGEWLRTQWIARVAFGLGRAKWDPEYATRVSRALRQLHIEDAVERREAKELRRGDLGGGVHVAFPIPRTEWRLTPRSNDAR